ncbi:hypothetical protein HRW23_04070 [Streptomyces lunaelactis]|uniref:hypothetical protein n=1 Tax=Streptomyces lunaelactis TaxID=1535768 RepID=UPI0015854861|nr:hypothetical protein [Streptomyces lunaelactis]NUK24460.1 hypothetical protein [Streptomyces lunaelactis]NUK36124.1 hypothetical protein [Streptomyces lunaelactis]NUK42703.1 hypothetical protein [Streptomyces lunaelactis]NUK52169.1 hypothetical protein [Streptomyces lunaelactis]NUK66029.1 hypothetical protein [Streptomyces lunaelactis]
MTPKGRTRRPAAALAVLAVLASTALIGGCGIRSTQVPVDAGPAPSRVPCEVSGGSVTPQAQQQGVPVRVYLVCASQLESVDRTAEIPEQKATGSRLRFAQALLDQLIEAPSDPEQEAGFATYVRGPLVLSGAREGDPAGTLRLSRQPEDLPASALAQIVCTFAESVAAATDGSVLLGGPGKYAPRGYQCSAGTKERPEEAVPTLGALPSPTASGAGSGPGSGASPASS